MSEVPLQTKCSPKERRIRREWALSLWQGFLAVQQSVQGYHAHKKTPPPPRSIIGSKAWSYCRVLGGVLFEERGTLTVGRCTLSIRRALFRRGGSWALPYLEACVGVS